MRYRSIIPLMALMLIFPLTEKGSADPLKDELKSLRARIEQLEKKLADQTAENRKQDATLAEHTIVVDELKSVSRAFRRLEFSVGATSVLQGTINNDRNHLKAPGIGEKGDDTDAGYSVDVEIGAAVAKNGRAFLHLEAGEGNGLNEEAAGLTGINADALGSSVDLEVAELWYEHHFLDGKLVATVGKLDPVVYFDASEMANDENIQFLADIFVNNPAVDWPDYAYGARLSYAPAGWFTLNFGFLEADGDYEDLFDDNFFIAETVFKPEVNGLPGNYRIYIWRNSDSHEKLRHTLRDDKSGEGFGLSVDQQLSEYITVFCRYGQQSDDIYEIRRAWSAGFQIAGGMWGRDEDMLGLAYGSAETGSAYRDVLRDDGYRIAPAETRIEAYYRFQINDHLALSPDFQWVDGLGSTDSADTVSIFGIRTRLDF